MRRNNIILYLIFILFLISCDIYKKNSDSLFINSSLSINGLYAPWDNLNDETTFNCFVDKKNFYFIFNVIDTTITYVPNFSKESDVEIEDRVEIFFSPHKTMQPYYCAEIDPNGNVLDYKGLYYRILDYDWDFTSLLISTRLTENGYIVLGQIDLQELENLGIDLYSGFYMGVFRADYKSDLTVNWYSSVISNDEHPDFHKPEMLFFTKILKQK